MREYPSPWTMASVGTDGSDFLPDVAGAVVDEWTLPRLSARGIDVGAWVDRYDSNGLFVQTSDSLISTGNTGTNVGDVIVYVLK
jgi:glycerate-2-kinase